MLMKSCVLCKIVGIFAILGAANTAILGLKHKSLIDHFLVTMPHKVSLVVYGLIGVSALALLASYFMVCPACKKS